MSLSPRQFYLGLYLEHLEEASFLYDQRRALFANPEIAWTRIGEFEDRFEAHLDALVIGADLALEVCKKQTAEGDAGELHAAVRVFCRQNRKDLFLGTLEELALDDPDKCRAVADALCHELPGDWEDDLAGLLFGGDPRLIPHVARVLGYRRVKGRTDLAALVPKAPAGAAAPVLWALGRLGDPAACSVLSQQWAKQETASARWAAALALLRQHDPHILTACMRTVCDEGWPALALGLGGGRLAVQILLDVAGSAKATADGYLALGLLGGVTAVASRVDRLTNSADAEAVALALHLITGAQLWEEAVIPEPLDEDELFDDERIRLKQGEAPPSTGTRVTRLSQSAEVWWAWWSANQRRFHSATRYRLGRPYSPAVLLDTLLAEQSPHKVRQLVYEELVVRYGADFTFEADLPVTAQRQALASLREWVKVNGGRFQEGVWYYAGRPCSLRSELTAPKVARR
ncbi:MAG: hypothetical protein IT429_10905 [Gemmataceae bacterium]|nr:hypothetical protein [Gemmataceae bacterium]